MNTEQQFHTINTFNILFTHLDQYTLQRQHDNRQSHVIKHRYIVHIHIDTSVMCLRQIQTLYAGIL